MGLDMYLDRVPKIPGYNLKQLEEISGNLDELIAMEQEAIAKNPAVKIKVYEDVKPYIIQRGSQSFNWPSLFEEMGYWRKANAIHKWFVDCVQDGVDECETHEVSREQVESLLHVCKRVLETKGDEEVASSLLPSQEGFFFGSTDYDQYYYEDVEMTIQILEKVLKEVDFENNYLTYRSSW